MNVAHSHEFLSDSFPEASSSLSSPGLSRGSTTTYVQQAFTCGDFHMLCKFRKHFRLIVFESLMKAC